jgi:hypothetical protein
MIVDFVRKRTPSFRVGSITRIGPWKVDNLKTEFGELLRWAKKQKVRTGRWIFFERDHHRWEACLEIKGNAEAEGRISLKVLAAASVVSVAFDPDRISSRIVYHGLNDWTRWQIRDREIKSVSAIREVYSGNPWKDKRAWANCEVQFIVRK